MSLRWIACENLSRQILGDVRRKQYIHIKYIQKYKQFNCLFLQSFVKCIGTHSNLKIEIHTCKTLQ